MQAIPLPYPFFPNNSGLYTYTPVPCPVAYDQPVPALTYAASSPESIASPRTPNVTSTTLPLQQTPKKSRSRKSKDPNHPKQPPNPFIRFRSEHNKLQKASNANTIHQQDISITAGLLWGGLPSEEKKIYEDAAAEEMREYRKSLPQLSHSEPSKKRNSTSIKRARAQKPYDRPPKKTKNDRPPKKTKNDRPPKKTKKRVKTKNNDVVPVEPVPSSAAVPFPEQWPQPQLFINPMLTQYSTNTVVQTDHATAYNPNLTYWPYMSPMPPIDTTTQSPAQFNVDTYQAFESLSLNELKTPTW